MKEVCLVIWWIDTASPTSSGPVEDRFVNGSVLKTYFLAVAFIKLEKIIFFLTPDHGTSKYMDNNI